MGTVQLRRLEVDTPLVDLASSVRAAGPYALLDGGGPGAWSCLGFEVEAVLRGVVEPSGEVRFTMGDEVFVGPLLPTLRRIEAETRVPLSAAPAELPFCSGWMGVLGYGLARAFEPQLPRREDDLGLPDLVWVRPRAVVARDREGRTWLSVRGDEAAWLAVAERLSRAPRTTPGPSPARRHGPTLRYAEAPAAYEAQVEAMRAHIGRGEAFELCLTQRIELGEAPVDPLALHRALAAESPAAYAGVLEVPGFALVSASPELYLSVSRAGRLETRPIKGTRPRGQTPAEDEAIARGLARSPKDVAENLMIVDLARSDLARVAAPGSVEAGPLLTVERYATVHQLVSTVAARLGPGLEAWDAVAATFPGGSMTGAPKLEAMERLAEAERHARGPYAGGFGFHDDRGDLTLAMVIRSAYGAGRRWFTHAGGAVTWDSRAPDERAEMELKTEALARALARLDAPETPGAPTTPGPELARGLAPARTAWRSSDRLPRERILVVDHFDSFTHNLVELLARLGETAWVLRPHELSLEALLATRPRAIVLSPGPGDPRDPARLGVTRAILAAQRPNLPVLGVCLGHQAIVLASDGEVRAAPPTHGKVERFEHSGAGLFAGLPSPLEGMRYHSLGACADRLPSALVLDAWTADGWAMAVRHRALPWWGLQFHPESVGTPEGSGLVGAFLEQLIPGAQGRKHTLPRTARA